MNIKKLKIKKINIIENDDVFDITVKNNHNFFANNVCVHNCSEITLSELDSCRLMTINLFSYVENPFTENSYFNYELFSKHTKYLQRLMDNMIDLEIEKIDKIIDKINSDPENNFDKSHELEMWKKVKNNAILGRRTGSGIIGLGDTLAALGFKYDSDEAFKEVEKIFDKFDYNLFLSSIVMSEELGPFPIYDSEKEENNAYILKLKKEHPELISGMRKFGRRNISLSTIAPTGSISMLSQVTSGIEPAFMLEYKRRKKINPTDKNIVVDFVDQNGDKWQEFKIYHTKYKDWMDLNPGKKFEESPYYMSTAETINPVKKVKLIGLIQKYITHSISNTTNLPNTATTEDVNDIYFNAWKSGCKGVTVYRSGSRTGVLVEDKPTLEIKEYTFENNAEKRPKKLNAEIHHMKISGIDYYVSVGFLNNKPYEIFVGSNHVDDPTFKIAKNIKIGEIVKIKRGLYELHSGNEKFTISCRGCNATTEALTRMISTSLRHNVDISFVVDQLEKIDGFDSYPKVLARTLKKYIKNGTPVVGETCPNCGSQELVREEGCVNCKSCGYSKCS